MNSIGEKAPGTIVKATPASADWGQQLNGLDARRPVQAPADGASATGTPRAHEWTSASSARRASGGRATRRGRQVVGSSLDSGVSSRLVGEIAW